MLHSALARQTPAVARLARRQVRAALRARLVVPHPAAAPARPASTAARSAPFTFLSRKPLQPSSAASSSSSTSPIDGFHAAVASRRLRAIRAAYNALARAPAGSRGALSPADFLAAMRALSRDSPLAVELMHRMFADMEPVFGVAPGAEHVAALVPALARFDYAAALAVAADAPAVPVAAWRALLERDEHGEAHHALRTVVHGIERTGAADETVYALRLRYVGPGDEAEAALLAEMVQRGVQPGLAWDVERARRRRTAGDVDGAHAILSQIELPPDEAPDQAMDGNDEWLAAALFRERLKVAVARADGDALRALLAALMDRGLAPPLFALRWIVNDCLARASSTVGDVVAAVETVEDVLGRPALSKIWGSAIDTYLSLSPAADRADTAHAVYLEARGRSVPADWALAAAVIGALTAAEPSPARLRAALDVYADHDAHMRDSGEAPSLPVYEALLSACARATPAATEAAVALCADMRAHRLLLPRSFASSTALDLVRGAATHDDAYAGYAALYGTTRALGADDYRAIVSALVLLDTPASPLPPAPLVLSLMADMARAGHAPGPEVLTSLLSRYASMGAQARSRKASRSPAHRAALAAGVLGAVREIHTLLRLDPALVTDVALLAALMNAYQHWGAADDALAVWDELVERRPRELAAAQQAAAARGGRGTGGVDPADAVARAYGPAISVVLDTCAHAGLPARARKAFAWARRHGLVRARHWDGWVECLARTGRLDEAVRVVCADMGAAGVPAPTKNTAAILLKFSWAHGSVAAVADAVRQRFPQWWDELAPIVETARTRREAAAAAAARGE